MAGSSEPSLTDLDDGDLKTGTDFGRSMPPFSIMFWVQIRANSRWLQQACRQANGLTCALMDRLVEIPQPGTGPS